MTPRFERPWWIEAIYKLGVPSAIAAFLLWYLVTQVSASMTAIENKVSEHSISSTFYLHAICVNAARTESERANCIEPQHLVGPH